MEGGRGGNKEKGGGERRGRRGREGGGKRERGECRVWRKKKEDKGVPVKDSG